MWTTVGEIVVDEGLTSACIQKIWDTNSHYFTDKMYGTGFKEIVVGYKWVLTPCSTALSAVSQVYSILHKQTFCTMTFKL